MNVKEGMWNVFRDMQLLKDALKYYTNDSLFHNPNHSARARDTMKMIRESLKFIEKTGFEARDD